MLPISALRTGAVHGKYVPGLPWDRLPPPIWEPEPADDDEPDPWEAQIRQLAGELNDAEDEQAYYEEEAREHEARADGLRAQAVKLLDQLRRVNPRREAELAKELDL